VAIEVGLVTDGEVLAWFGVAAFGHPVPPNALVFLQDLGPGPFHAGKGALSERCPSRSLGRGRPDSNRQPPRNEAKLR